MRNIILVVLGALIAIWVGVELLGGKGGEPEKTESVSDPSLGAVKEIPVGTGPPLMVQGGDAGGEQDLESEAASSRDEPEEPDVAPEPTEEASPESGSPEAGRKRTSKLPLERSPEIEKALGAVNQLIESKRPLEALRLHTRLLAKVPEGAARADLRGLLDRHVSRFVFSRAPLESGMTYYTIERGDTLDGICRSFRIDKGWNVSPGFVCSVNGISNPRRIRAGERIKFLHLPLHIEVSKAHHRLSVVVGGVSVKEFGVGLGKHDKTPVGSFVIKTKQVDPAWTWEGRTLPAGHPENILGTRWMGFENKDGLFGYGIHGTLDNTSIGKDESNGCVRMRNEDVEALFEWIPRGTEVHITAE